MLISELLSLLLVFKLPSDKPELIDPKVPLDISSKLDSSDPLDKSVKSSNFSDPSDPSDNLLSFDSLLFNDSESDSSSDDSIFFLFYIFCFIIFIIFFLYCTFRISISKNFILIVI